MDSEAKTKTEHKIKIYSTPECPHCKAAKVYLNENKIVFEDVNVAEDHDAAHEMVEKSGQMGVPVLDIDGTIVIGFDEEKINELLKL